MSFSLQSLAPETRINVPTSALLDHFKATSLPFNGTTNSDNNLNSINGHSNFMNKDKISNMAMSRIQENTKIKTTENSLKDSWRTDPRFSSSSGSGSGSGSGPDSKSCSSSFHSPEILEIDGEDVCDDFLRKKN